MTRLCDVQTCPKGKPAPPLQDCKKCPNFYMVKQANEGYDYHCKGEK